MSDFKATMRQNRFRLVLHPDPPGSLQSFLKLTSWNKGDLLIREGEWKGGGGKALGRKMMGIFKFS